MRIRNIVLAASAALLAVAAALPASAQTSAAIAGPAAAVSSLQVELAAAPANPALPQMGDRLSYRTSIRNVGTAPVAGIVAWLGLVQVDQGKEQPVIWRTGARTRPSPSPPSRPARPCRPTGRCGSSPPGTTAWW